MQAARYNNDETRVHDIFWEELPDQWNKCAHHPNWDYYSSNAFVCHKFLEVEVNCQKSVCTESRESRDAKQWRIGAEIYRNKGCLIWHYYCHWLHYFVESLWYMQHKLAELVNQHGDQKQPDSEAMFLNFWTRTKSFLSRRLLQCSAWWCCWTSTRLIRKARDMTNPFDDLFG